jgi:translocation and assembly module TamB
MTASGDVNLRMIGALLNKTGGPSLTTSGVATISASVSGNGNATRLTGFIDIKDFALRSIDLPVAITNGTGRMIFNENAAQVQTLTAQAGGGKLNVTGGVYLSGFIPDRWRFEFTGDQVRMNYPEDVRTVIDGDLTYQGNRKLQVLSGNVNVRRAEYTRDLDIADLIINSRSQIAGGGEGLGSTLSLDITVRSHDTLFIRNNVADAVGSATLRIHGSADDPVISGQITVTRGNLDFRGSQYRLTRGLIQLPDSKTGEPYFNIQAESDIKGYRVIIPFVGTLSKFSVQPRTDPPLEQADVIALITTGDILPQDTQRSQALVQAGVGTATSLLTESLTRRVEQRTSRLFGINRLQVDPLIVGRGNDPTARVTVGRQITKDLSVTYSTNITQSSQSVFLVEYRLSDRFSFVGVRDQEGRIGFELRVRKRF